MKLELSWLLLALPALACGPDVEGVEFVDAARPDTRVSARDLAAPSDLSAPPDPPAADPDAAPSTPPVPAPPPAVDAEAPADASPAPFDGAPAPGDAAPVAPIVEAAWSYTDCDQDELMYPNIDRNMGRFPPGSCPPPETLSRDCGGDSKIPVVAATSSSYETDSVHPPQYAVDEYLMTRWSSTSGAYAWLALDLGAEKTFKRIYLAWELAHGSGYDIEVSPDGRSWTTLKEVRGGNGFQDIVDLEATSRHVRILGVTRGAGNSYGYSLFDVTLCGERP